jgi:hypothetical protein
MDLQTKNNNYLIYNKLMKFYDYHVNKNQLGGLKSHLFKLFMVVRSSTRPFVASKTKASIKNVPILFIMMIQINVRFAMFESNDSSPKYGTSFHKTRKYLDLTTRTSQIWHSCKSIERSRKACIANEVVLFYFSLMEPFNSKIQLD